jgi:hypothetical protein
MKLYYSPTAGEKGDHDYLPKTQEEAAQWEPHDWVISAIQEAEFKGSMI